MNEQNTARIIAACPSLFDTMGDEQNSMIRGNVFTPIAFGFECGDGWADLLVECCEKIQTYLNTLDPEVAKYIVALQIKEKYGTLRFYLSSYDETIENYIQDAERKSAQTCEQCGAEGRCRGSVWLYTACDAHTRKEDLKNASETDLS